MPENVPYPGEPSPPWSVGGADQPYREPADPWGDQPDAGPHQHTGSDHGEPRVGPAGHRGSAADRGQPGPGDPDSGWGGGPPSMPMSGSTGGYPGPAPGAYPGFAAGGGYPAGPGGWAAQPAPARRQVRSGMIVSLVGVLSAAVCGGLGVTAWLLVREPPQPRTLAPGPSPTALAPTAGNDVNPAPRSSNDARFVAKGQCVRNDGTADKPEMTIAECGNGTYQVLARVNGTTTGEADAEAKCAKVPDYTKWFYYDSELDSLDFVLCLRER